MACTNILTHALILCKNEFVQLEAACFGCSMLYSIFDIILLISLIYNTCDLEFLYLFLSSTGYLFSITCLFLKDFILIISWQ